MSIIPCSKYTFKIIPEYFELLNLDNLYCINISTNIYLKGDFNQKQWTYLNFEFNKCINSSSNNNSCAPQEEIDSRLDGGYIGMFMTDLNVIPNNFHNPTSVYGKNVFTTFSAKEYLDLWLYLKRIQLNTDSGLLLDFNNIESFFGLDSLRETRDFRIGINFLTVKIRMSLSRNVNERSYEKLQTLAANIGGLMKLCLLLGEIMVYFFRDILYKDYLVSYFTFNSQSDSEIPNDQPTSMPFYSYRLLSNIWLNREKSSINFKKPFTSKVSNKKLQVNPGPLCQAVTPQIASFNSNRSNQKSTITLDNYIISEKPKTTIQSKDLFCFCFFEHKLKITITKILKRFSRISFSFDVISYLKIKNDIKVINKKIFDDPRFLLYLYNFELPSIQDKEICDYYIGKSKYLQKHKKFYTEVNN